jgi:D-3-phosphoglycerate dehydrogenase
MAERLGHFSLTPPRQPRNIQITYTGRLATGKTISSATPPLQASSRPDGEGTTANRINAAAIAAERGIRIQEDKKEFTTGASAPCSNSSSTPPTATPQASATVLHGTLAPPPQLRRH